MPDFVGWGNLPRFPFGDSPEIADALLSLILDGRKTATCWSAAEGVKDTKDGGRWIVEDGDGRPRALLETTALYQRRFDLVDKAFAAAEGEGDLSLSYWREAHEAYFVRNGEFAPDMPLWCEHFRLIKTI